MRRKKRQKRRQLQQQRTRRNKFISNGSNPHQNKRKFAFLHQISLQNLKRKQPDYKRNYLGDKSHKPYTKQLTPDRINHSDMQNQVIVNMQNYYDNDFESQSLFESKYITPYKQANFDTQK